MLPLDSDKINHTKDFLCAKNVLERLPSVFRNQWPDSTCFLIADENTYGVCGAKVRALLSDSGIALEGEKIYPGRPTLHGDYRHCLELIPELNRYPRAIPLVIGSGSLNDIVKRAAYEAERSYAVVATAASVDGYASDGAALLENGVKHTMTCPAPGLILADTDILATAPWEMTAAGYGDLLAKYPAGGDWILADLTGLDPIDPLGWSLVHDRLNEWTSDPEGLARREVRPLVSLFEGLTYAGFAMQYMKQSRPVSGAEHLLSHIWEMSGHLYQGEGVSHGFQVSVGSVICIKLMNYLIHKDVSSELWDKALTVYKTPEQRESGIRGLFDFLDDQKLLFSINREKSPEKPVLEKRLHLLRDQWSVLTGRWKEELPSADDFIRKLSTAGCPVHPSDIGVGRAQVGETLIRAQYLRNRYTILDLLYEMGLFENMDEILDVIY